MIKLLKITTQFVALIILLGATNLCAQERGEERTDVESERHWFWNWLYGEISNDGIDQSIATDVYENVNLKMNLSMHWRFSIGDNKSWASPTYNDNNWEKIKVPSDWENDGFNGYDGYAWYRIHFDGTMLNKSITHFLILGIIDDVDETYLNGHMIGRSGSFPPRYRTAYNSNRKYHIPDEAINFNGDNVIAVRVYDEHLSGGIVSGKPGIYTSEGSEELLQDLYGTWKFQKYNDRSYSQIELEDDHWEDILVPAYWDNQGYRSFDGTAWYRKQFSLNFKPEAGKTYYLLLGRIDDFDITYLNGKEIGRTDDGKDYGQSKSYKKLRLYEIPKGLLNEDDKNIIAVKVHDFGNGGGIYQGPIGIIEQESVTKFLRSNN